MNIEMVFIAGTIVGVLIGAVVTFFFLQEKEKIKKAKVSEKRLELDQYLEGTKEIITNGHRCSENSN